MTEDNVVLLKTQKSFRLTQLWLVISWLIESDEVEEKTPGPNTETQTQKYTFPPQSLEMVFS